MEQTLGANVTNHYRRNRDTYDQISTRLREARAQFAQENVSGKIKMLQKSHSFAVISVQTPVHIHEEAYARLWENGQPLADLEYALERVNYNNQKSEYIRHSLVNMGSWEHVVELIEDGEIDSAHKYILDTFKGVGPAKAPFVLSMLGFEEKMCIDANIINAFDLDGHVSTVVVEKYDAICQRLRDRLPTMRDLTTPFMFQWVTFDYQRGEVSEHEVFYSSL